MRLNTEDGKLGGVIEETIFLVKQESISRCLEFSTKKKKNENLILWLQAASVQQTCIITQVTNKLEEMQDIESTHFLTPEITAS